MRKASYTKEEVALLQEVLDQGKIINLSVLCRTLNEQFHNGVCVREPNGVKLKLYRLGHETPRPHPDHDPKSSSLCRLVTYAKEIKKMTDTFCQLVTEFEEDYKQEKEVMKKLTKIREAVEDFHDEL